MPPTQTTAPSMCSAKASAAMSGRPVRGTIKRYYSGYTLAYASYGKEGIGTLRHFPAQRNLDASGGKADIRRGVGYANLTRTAIDERDGGVREELAGGSERRGQAGRLDSER